MNDILQNYLPHTNLMKHTGKQLRYNQMPLDILTEQENPTVIVKHNDPNKCNSN